MQLTLSPTPSTQHPLPRQRSPWQRRNAGFLYSLDDSTFSLFSLKPICFSLIKVDAKQTVKFHVKNMCEMSDPLLAQAGRHPCPLCEPSSCDLALCEKWVLEHVNLPAGHRRSRCLSTASRARSAISCSQIHASCRTLTSHRVVATCTDSHLHTTLGDT